MQYFGAFGLRNDFVLCLQFLKDFGYTPTRYDIVGFSTGASAALQYAMQRIAQRQRIGKILLLSPVLYAPLLPTKQVCESAHNEILNHELKPHTQPTKIHKSVILSEAKYLVSQDNEIPLQYAKKDSSLSMKVQNDKIHESSFCARSPAPTQVKAGIHEPKLHPKSHTPPIQIHESCHSEFEQSENEESFLSPTKEMFRYAQHDKLMNLASQSKPSTQPTKIHESQLHPKPQTPLIQICESAHNEILNHELKLHTQSIQIHKSIEITHSNTPPKTNSTQTLLAALAPHTPCITHLSYESMARALPHIPQHTLWNLFQQACLDCYQNNTTAYYETLYTQIGFHKFQHTQTQIQGKCEVFTHQENIDTLRGLWHIESIDFHKIQKKSSVFAIFLPECDNITNSIWLSDYLAQFGICYTLKGYNHMLQKS